MEPLETSHVKASQDTKDYKEQMHHRHGLQIPLSSFLRRFIDFLSASPRYYKLFCFYFLFVTGNRIQSRHIESTRTFFKNLEERIRAADLGGFLNP